MPIYEYRCQDCGNVIEVFQQTSDHSPRLCGFRCALPRDTELDCRGMGSLERIMSVPSGHLRAAVKGDHPTVGQMEKAGFSVYENTGRGVKKISGKGGPDKVEFRDD